MGSARMMRRPPPANMLRQFLKLALISFQVGMLVTVLSQFCTLTVCRLISITAPSAFSLGISIQSSTRSMSLLANCTPATNDRIVSLNTSISTADMAPRPESSSKGERSSTVATISSRATMPTVSLPSCT